MEKTLVLCLEDRDYLERLGDYMSGKKKEGVNIVCFSTPDALRRYLIGHQPDLVAYPEEWESEVLSPISWSVKLTRRVTESGEDLHLLSCFLPPPVLSSHLLKMLETERETGTQEKNETPVQAVDSLFSGVYCPGGFREQTSFCLEIARMLGKDGKTLFLSLREFPGGKGLSGGAGDLSDAAYLFQKGRLTGESMREILLAREEFDLLRSPANPEQLRELEGEGMLLLAKNLAETGGYCHVLVDFGASLAGELPLMEQCSPMITLFSPEEIPGGAAAEWESFCRNTGRSGFWDHQVRVLALPVVSEGPKRPRGEDRWKELIERGMACYAFRNKAGNDLPGSDSGSRSLWRERR